MKKILVLFSFFIFSFSFTYAQHDSCKHTPKAYVNICGGVGLSPNTIFMPSSKVYWMDYLQPGINLNISGDIPLFHSYFGITARVSYYSNGYDMNKYISDISQGITTEKFTASSYGAFTQYAYMAGAFAAYAVGKTTIEVRVIGGVEDVILPNYAYIVSYPLIPGTTETDSYFYTNSLSLAFGAGAQVAYAITNHLSATYSTDILITNSPYNLTAYRNLTPSNASGPGVAAIAMLNAVLGLSYTFGK